MIAVRPLPGDSAPSGVTARGGNESHSRGVWVLVRFGHIPLKQKKSNNPRERDQRWRGQGPKFDSPSMANHVLSTKLDFQAAF